jgi:hypothetical protein
MLITLLAAATLSQATGALPPKECRDDNHADRCAPEDRARIVASLGMASADAEAKTGVEAYRAFFVDGYGNDRPTIAFERRPGEPPKAVVYARGRKIEALASATSWREVTAGARFADRGLVELPSAGSGLGMCLHAWVTSVEIVNASPRDGGSSAVRSRTENACDSGLTTQFGFKLAALAIQQFPACDALKADDFRNDVERLAFCTKLHGDTAAAAQWANQIGARLTLRKDIEPAGAWHSWMGINSMAELNWAGQVIKDDYRRENRLGKFLATQDAAANLDLSPARIEGLDGRQVKVTGRIFRYPSGAERMEVAPYEQTWIWDTGLFEWMLKSWTVGAFALAE